MEIKPENLIKEMGKDPSPSDEGENEIKSTPSSEIT